MKTDILKRFTTSDTSGGGGFEVGYAKLMLRAMPGKRFRIYRMLARLMEADIDTRTALEFIYEVVSRDGKKKGEPDAVAVEHWLRAYRESGKLSEAVVGWVPQTELLMLETGENSGRFQFALNMMLRLNEKVGSIYGQVVTKLAYPAIMALVALLSVYYLSISFLPQLLALNSKGIWTGSGASLIAFLTWASNWMPIALIGVFGAIVAIIATLPHFRGPLRDILDVIPPWSVNRFVSGVAFLKGVLVLMESGRGLVEAISLVRPNVSPYLAAKIEPVERALREGHDFGAALAQSEDQFPDMELVKEIQIYSRIGRLDEGLFNVVEQWIDTATGRTNAQITVFATVMLGGVFLLLGFVMTGMFDVVGQIKGN